MNVYDECPVLENDKFKIRLMEEADADDLFKVYSDKQALPYFNSDNCNGTNFYCEKIEYVKESIKYWLLEYYENRGFVRFSIVDKQKHQVIGSVEMFRRESKDSYNQCGLLRVDVRSDYEKTESLYEIFSIIVEPFYGLFKCSCIATKGALYAVERIEALKKMNFVKTQEPIKGQKPDEIYRDYWIRRIF